MSPRALVHHILFQAAEKLAASPDGADTLRWLLFGPIESVRLAAAWGLALLGFYDPALQFLGAHAYEIIPRFIDLGPRGIRALCECPRELFGDSFGVAVALLAYEKRHTRLLTSLTAEGSELARRALQQHKSPEEKLLERIFGAEEEEDETAHTD